MFTGLYALVIGLIGAVWRLALAEAPAVGPSRKRYPCARVRYHPNTTAGGRLTMDLLLISRKIWRYRLVTLPVIALTLLGAFYVIAIKAPEYKVSSSYILINPPPPPTPDEIARNPALGRINPNNPYTRFSDQTVIVSLLSSSLSSDTARQELVNAGADPRYTVSPTCSSVTRAWWWRSPEWAPQRKAPSHRRAGGCGPYSRARPVQASQGVDPHYMIKTQAVVAPDSPKLQVSSTLRPLVGVLAIGAILLLLVVSAAEALETLRAELNQRGPPEERRTGRSDRGQRDEQRFRASGEELLREDENDAALEVAATNNPR